MEAHKIKSELAKLDGLGKHHQFKCSDPWDGGCDVCGGKAPSTLHSMPNYLTSYDAILSLVQKQSRAIRANIFIRCGGDGIDTPAQLCEALLKATNRWQE